MKTLTRDDVPDTFDPALLELSMEICADAISAATRAGIESMRPTRLQLQLSECSWCSRLYKIEVPNAAQSA